MIVLPEVYQEKIADLKSKLIRNTLLTHTKSGILACVTFIAIWAYYMPGVTWHIAAGLLIASWAVFINDFNNKVNAYVNVITGIVED